MAKVYFVLALIVQGSLIYADTDENMIHENEEEITSREVLIQPEIDDEVIKDFHEGKKDWMDMFMATNKEFCPSPSAALMASITNSNKSAEEQLEDIKEMATKITLAIQCEMANLLSYALNNCDKYEKHNDENTLRKKRETPMDSSQLVMRLLKHIKANNEYQNIAIEKMMTAQEIADKFGIEFNPDTEILSDLAFAANEQAKEMSSILQDACDSKNATKHVQSQECIEFVPLEWEQSPIENDTYYVYSVQPEEFVQSFPPHEYMPEPIYRPPVNCHHDHHYNPNHYETQMPPPPHHFAPVSPKPNFYDSVMPYPVDHYPYCPVEPMTTTTTIVLPIEEVVEPEPQLVGEEYEETVSSKMIVSRDEEPGMATVNHVMTYTLSEKAHFKKPEIENLPQQMQYTFFLM
ncbi:uncharacterized protein LOC126376379 [Pectinophora gossypiella]|uniref:uncharacterized protein LOC126376379 n=1 Tax=Pectinophora gossypiella TaxID=13191 RepID=UPI00214E2603|nr:uncharacterized protein LOC126376379 [Pectinophora gossypiella]